MREPPEQEAGLRLVAPRRGALRLLLGSAGFVLLGVWLARAGSPLIGGSCVAFFGLGVLVGAVSLLRPGTLVVAPDGLHVRHLGLSWPPLHWRHCSGFRPWHGPGAALVAFDHDGPRPRWRPGMSPAGTRALTGRDLVLPDAYGRTAEDLAALLEQARQRHLRAGS